MAATIIWQFKSLPIVQFLLTKKKKFQLVRHYKNEFTIPTGDSEISLEKKCGVSLYKIIQINQKDGNYHRLM
jgi:hypothetical protein